MKRVVWKEGDVVLLKLNEKLFTVGQMLTAPYMLFFQLDSTNGIISGVDLNEVPELFIVPVANNFLQARGIEKIKKGVIPKRSVRVPVLWIQAKLWPRGEFVWKGGDLVRIDPEKGDLGINNPIVKRDISANDRDTLEKYELTNVWTDHPLTPRLVVSIREGRNFDPLKEKIFFGKDSHGIMG